MVVAELPQAPFGYGEQTDRPMGKDGGQDPLPPGT